MLCLPQRSICILPHTNLRPLISLVILVVATLQEKPTLLAVIDAEIEKRKDDSPAAPTLKFKSDSVVEENEDDEDESGEAGGRCVF